jgi:hypothetical protein
VQARAEWLQTQLGAQSSDRQRCGERTTLGSPHTIFIYLYLLKYKIMDSLQKKEVRDFLFQFYRRYLVCFEACRVSRECLSQRRDVHKSPSACLVGETDGSEHPPDVSDTLHVLLISGLDQVENHH